MPAPALEAPPISQRPFTRWLLTPAPRSGPGANCFSTSVVPSTATPSPSPGSAARTPALASVLPATTWHWAGRPSAVAAPGASVPSRLPLGRIAGRAPAQGFAAMLPLHALRSGSQPRRRLLPSSPQLQSSSNQPMSQSAWWRSHQGPVPSVPPLAARAPSRARARARLPLALAAGPLPARARAAWACSGTSRGYGRASPAAPSATRPSGRQSSHVPEVPSRARARTRWRRSAGSCCIRPIRPWRQLSGCSKGPG